MTHATEEKSSSISESLGSIATQLLIENEKTNVWDLVLQPGEATDWHKHKYDYLYVVINNGNVYAEYLDGTREYQDDEIGNVHLIKADAVHRLVNVGSEVYRNIVVELKC